MNPKPAYKKFLLPGLAIAALVIVGLLLFLKDGAVDQGASLLTGITKTSSLRAVPPVATSCRPTVGANGLPVAPAPSIKVTSPNGGETFAAGQQITVTWSTCNIPATGNAISIQLRGGFPGSAVNFMELAPSNYSVNDGSETVTLPTQAINSFMQYGNNFKIKVSIEGYAEDQSDNLFSIFNTSINTGYVSSSTSISTQGPVSNDDAGQFWVKFSVTAVDGDVYLPRTYAKAIGDGAHVVHNNISVTQGTTYNFSTSYSNLVVTPNNNYLIPEGETANFWVTSVVSLPTAGTAGAYRLVVSSVKWSPIDSVNPTQIKLFNPVYQSSFLSLN